MEDINMITTDDDDDEERRRREINMFAAFALGGEEPIAGFGLGGGGLDPLVTTTPSNNDQGESMNYETMTTMKYPDSDDLPSDLSLSVVWQEEMVRSTKSHNKNEKRNRASKDEQQPTTNSGNNNNHREPLSKAPPQDADTGYASSSKRSKKKPIVISMKDENKDIDEGIVVRSNLASPGQAYDSWSNRGVKSDSLNEAKEMITTDNNTRPPPQDIASGKRQRVVCALPNYQVEDEVSDNDNPMVSSWEAFNAWRKDNDDNDVPVKTYENSNDLFFKTATATPPNVHESGTSTHASSTPTDSGTFTYAASGPGKTDEQQSNLDAAVAALSKSENQQPKNQQPPAKRSSRIMIVPKPLLDQERQKQKKSTEDICMFAEEVIMPRPLFFGAVIPPRVLEEARQMVKAAVERYFEDQKRLVSLASPPSSPTSTVNSQDSGATIRNNTRIPPRLYELPVDVRNVVGALRTYGYGLLEEVIKDLEAKPTTTQSLQALFDNSIDLSNTNTGIEKVQCFGNPYVSTFQPVWGNDVRLERVKMFRKQQKKLLKQQRPKQLAVNDRSITAPARLPVMSQSEDDTEDDHDVSQLGSLSGDDGVYSPFNLKTTIPHPKSSIESDLRADGNHEFYANRQPAQGLRASASGVTPNELFSTWLRAEDENNSSNVRMADSASSPRSKQTITASVSPQAAGGQAVQVMPGNSLPATRTTDISDDDDDDDGDNSEYDAASNSNKNCSIASGVKSPLTEQELFSKWARESGSSTAMAAGGSVSLTNSITNSSKDPSIQAFSAAASSCGTFNPMNTFQRMPVDEGDVGSDDGSVIDDEQKKQVGVNDHLSKAIALLADDGQQTGNEVTTLEQTQVLLSQLANDGSRKRPLTNYELTCGCVPLFGVDDASLPQEADLGIHETKEEQQRAQEQKRSQEIIEKFVAPNVFGTVASPNPAAGPDDVHSWMSRSVLSSGSLGGRIRGASMSGNSGTPELSGSVCHPNRRQFNSYGSAPPAFEPLATPPTRDSARSRSEGNSADLLSAANAPAQQQRQTASRQQFPRPPKHTGKRSGDSGIPAPSVPSRHKQSQSTSFRRFGWWNGVDENNVEDDENVFPDEEATDSTILQVPPLHHSANSVQVETNLDPKPDKLRLDNLPLSRMHAATSMEQSLPYLSDRPHSYRYLQIDTQTIAFPPIKGEIEPFFCSMAIYNVETISNIGILPSLASSSTCSNSGQRTKPAPIPNLQRCGRVTEALYFDHVLDEDVAKRCAGSLYPHSKGNVNSEVGSYGGASHLMNTMVEESEKELLQGTRCGVFPIPSNLNVANLYAVLVVRKVIADEVDLEAYVKPGTGGKNGPLDIEKLKATAEKNSNQHGSFLMPFAFGVAPLLQVFGTENPTVASSRAVQIPLFRFTEKESQIIDHIMVMLYPKANHKANGIQVAPVTNGGTAMLVMRNFGYLGLHHVIDTKSSLARDRLVDFTGELQVRLKGEDEENKTRVRLVPEQFDGYKIILPDWQPQYVAEPTKNGGRFADDGRNVDTSLEISTSKSYAQELLPLPLHMSPASRLSPGMSSGIARGQTSEDIEPYYLTSFCNEALCHPRILHNCPKGNVVVKVELREVEWNEDINGYLAHVPSCGPSVHNPRRGPFLVQGSFTSCTSRRSHEFMDEFKVKLPLALKSKTSDGGTRNLSFFFTVFKIKLGNPGRWKRGAKLLFGSAASSDTYDATEEHGVSGNTRLDQIACGFLPITEQSCLIENGLHDVRMMYKATSLPDNSSALMLKECFEDTALIGFQQGKEDSYAEDTIVSENSYPKTETTGFTNDGGSDLATLNKYSPLIKLPRSKVNNNESMSLSVRLVIYSSLHSQNLTLSDFLNQETDIPLLSQLPNKVFLSTLRMGRDYLTTNTNLDGGYTKFHSLDERLMESTIAITDHQLCSVSSSASYMLRIMSRLWRSLICGNGEPNLAWTNPGTSMPLRVHSFATIAHLVGATSLYLSKNGVTHLDGIRKWNVVTFGRVLALLFNEGVLFGSQAIEKFDETYWAAQPLNPSPASRKKTRPLRKRHFRNNYDLFNDLPPREIPRAQTSGILSSQAGDLATPPQRRNLITPTQFTNALSGLPDLCDELRPAKQGLKVDSKIDFQQALRAANALVDEDLHKADCIRSFVSDAGRDNSSEDTSPQESRSVSVAGKAFVQAFGDISGTRRWMTAPTNILLTIPESENDDDIEIELISPENVLQVTAESNSLMLPSDPSLTGGHTEDVVTGVPKRTKQMRCPRRPSKPVDGEAPINSVVGEPPEAPLILTSDDDIESKGTAFLDTIGANIGMSFDSSNKNGEEQRVGSSHHRSKKNHNRSSIDWSLMSDNLTVPAQQPTQEVPIVVDEAEDDEDDENDESMSTLKTENSSYIKLPNFVDRLMIIGKASAENNRWFPFAYEVIIMQWAAILNEQRNSGEKSHPERSMTPAASDSASFAADKVLGQAALRSVGVAVASAPMLFEVIKQSLGFRVQSLFNQIWLNKGTRTTPPLAVLDDTLMDHLEHVIRMVTDACIDSRNFDSWDLRQMSIDVNDAIVRFLRDLFSFLAPFAVHRLILTYFSRFVIKDGKHFSDRDSQIGLRCSWEITKLRLNAVTAFARFVDLIKINSPQMLNWTNWWMSSPSRMTCKFYDEVLGRYEKFRLPQFVGNEDGNLKSIDIPTMKPHWLSEIIVDICLLGTEHAEQYIQHRSSSLLHETFWFCSQESILSGTSAPVASMFVTFLEKIASNASYLANFSAKSQLRKDILICALFVLQSAHANLLRALWRQLILRFPGKDLERKYLGELHPETTRDNVESVPKLPTEPKEEANVLGMFSLLNLALQTVEYEGCDDHVEPDSSGENRESLEVWHREYLLCRRKGKECRDNRKADDEHAINSDYTSSTSRKWQAHDGSIVIINSGHQIVREMYTMIRNLPNGKLLLNPAVQHKIPGTGQRKTAADVSAKARKFAMSKAETILFVRAATSLYLHALALRESDIVFVRTFLFSAEVIKMFGISVFLEAVGETLQHWMRLILFHCGARRAQVRIEATDLLELILRSSWECFGSFFRIRVPLLAVQTEVMERIVAIAASRYYREQRRTATAFEAFSNLAAEACLVPLWRTLDRIQKQPASQNIAFRGALIRIAGKLKKLYRAYVAARVLSFIKGTKDKVATDEFDEKKDFEVEALLRASRINMLRVINASAGHSKQFLGFQGTGQQRTTVAHFEAVEDALIDAADVFSPTELPEHRVAWLRMLAEFHSSRRKYAEEASCHYYIHETLHLASRLHGALWSNTPFLPWTDNAFPDPVIYVEEQTTEPDYTSDLFYEGSEWEYGQRESAYSFRRIFYRVANSLAAGNNEWDSGASKNLFYGITLPEEYVAVSPWITIREMEENMAEAVETAGHLFLNAGIIESSRFAWNLATQLYAEKFSYAKLSNAYSNLAKAVVSQVPPVDTSLPQEVLSNLGRFYRVWFHGGAPDDLSGVEFVYRTEGAIPLKKFGEDLRDIIKAIIPDKTPIHLVLDGLSEERFDDGSSTFTGFSRIGPAPLEPVRIKVTPLRPLFQTKNRGLPEWFNDYVDEAFSGPIHRSKNDICQRGTGRRKESALRSGHDVHLHDHSRSFSATIFSSAGSATATLTSRRGPPSSICNADRSVRFSGSTDSNLQGVDKFCFLQSRDRLKGSKEWWKTATGDFAEKSLKVTQLQVAQSFPACVTRQAVVHRLVYAQSPLEAGVDAVCQWCSILFRTIVSTFGMAVLKADFEPGIGTDAAKIVADCIHGSRLKDIGLALLKKESGLGEGESNTDFTLDHDRLSDDEVKKFQMKLSRLLITFFELLHLLIARNRDLLLNVIKERKKRNEIIGNNNIPASVTGVVNNPVRGYIRAASIGPKSSGDTPLWKNASAHKRTNTDGNQSDTGGKSETRSHHNAAVSDDQQSYQSMLSAAGVRTDSAIAVQSELQRSFIKLVKDLYPRIHGVLQSESPRWIKQCTNDNYFSMGIYKQTKVPIAEELCFMSNMETGQSGSHNSRHRSDSHLSHSDHGYDSPRGSIGGASQSSAISRGSDF